MIEIQIVRSKIPLKKNKFFSYFFSFRMIWWWLKFYWSEVRFHWEKDSSLISSILGWFGDDWNSVIFGNSSPENVPCETFLQSLLNNFILKPFFGIVWRNFFYGTFLPMCVKKGFLRNLLRSVWREIFYETFGTKRLARNLLQVSWKKFVAKPSVRNFFC
jgi:hypothetical protein